ncbi:hypothetical protein D3C74_261400 [compost metagenome]
MIVSDIIMEASIVNEITVGIGLIKSPILPGRNKSGANAATVASVAVMIDKDTSFVPLIAASVASSPNSERRRSMLSFTTTASSTSIPSTMINPMTEI